MRRPLVSIWLIAAMTAWFGVASQSRSGIAPHYDAVRGARRAVPERVLANDNRTPAGRMERDTLVVQLFVTRADWHLLGDNDPAFSVLAFGEEGRQPTIPGPLLRMPTETPIRVTIRNPLDDTLVVRGLGERGGVRDSLVVLPRATGEIAFVARRQGTYLYWGTVASVQRLMPAPRGGFSAVRQAGLVRPFADAPLAGAFVVDAPGPVASDRIFVINEITDDDMVKPVESRRDRHDTPIQFTALNGKSWPHTERLTYAKGDSVRWRLVNASITSHPMHLHGFFFRVDSHSNPIADADSIYTPAQRRMAVTEAIGIGEAVSIAWAPDRPGGWIFHCHLTNHVAKMPPADRRNIIDFPGMHDHGDPDQHILTGMNGLVLGVNVTGEPDVLSTTRPVRRLRLFVQSDSTASDSARRFGYVLQRAAEPRRDSVELPGSTLVLTRGQPTSIEVVNRSGEATAVHWHGIELESYYDGAVGWSGSPGRMAPAIRSGSSFEVRITPKRAGTFMYHTHFDEMRQQYGGLVGALVVLEPGEEWNPARDFVFLISDGPQRRLLINGSATPLPKNLEVGTTYRIRIADLAVYRPNVQVRLVRDSSLVSWRPVAKDGFTLPAAQSMMQPSVGAAASGEAADFEFTPEQPGDFTLEVRSPFAAAGVQLAAAIRFHVTPKAGRRQ